MAVIRHIMLLLILFVSSQAMADQAMSDAAAHTSQVSDAQPDNSQSPESNTPQGMTSEEWLWVKKTITQAMTFSHLNYQKELQSSSKNFTPEGWEQFTRTIVKNKFLEHGEDSFSITASLKSPPILVQSGQLGGNTTWLFQVPLLLLYRIGSEARVMRSDLHILIEHSQDKGRLLISGWGLSNPDKNQQ